MNDASPASLQSCPPPSPLPLGPSAGHDDPLPSLHASSPPDQITTKLPGQDGHGSTKGLLAPILDQNPYFSAGAGLMGIGVALSLLQKSAVRLGSLAQRRMLVTLEVNSKDPAYGWLLNWISHHTTNQAARPTPEPLGGAVVAASPSVGNAAGGGWQARLARIGSKSHQLAVETSFTQARDGGSEVKFALVPGQGVHYFRYRRAWFQAKRERPGKSFDITTGAPWETTTLTTLSRDRHLFPSLLAEARQLAHASREGRTAIYTAWGTDWKPFGQPRAPRLLDSVVLDAGQKERIVEDVTEFLGRSRWYAERGIPYRRGYLLYGPPGSGKSSFIMALAGSLGYNICAMNLSERSQTDDKLNHLLANVPEKSIVLLEDVDAAFVGRAAGEMRSNITFSGLLNAIDGVASSTQQRLLFMTTNHLHLLDPALIRPGRVDLAEHLGDATPYQASTLFCKFYAGTAGVSAPDLEGMREAIEGTIRRGAVEGKAVSMAGLQGVFVRCKSPGEAVGEVGFALESLEERAAKRRLNAPAPASGLR